VAEDDEAPKGSQRFLRTTNGARNTPPLTHTAHHDNTDARPWNEKYGPVSLDELAVHKKKVADVRAWLSDVFDGKQRKRLLLLKGPAGSGKTTTMSLLSKELGFYIHEWKNPIGTISGAEGFVSVTAQFEDFVGRTGAFGSLSFAEQAQDHKARSTSTAPDRQRQLIMVEEFPNTFTRTSSAVQSFRSSVLHYLAANTPSATAFFAGSSAPAHQITPVVMIVSETLLSTNTAAADSFTAHRLLGPEILTHPGATVIEFNPVAQTFMTKALDLVVMKEARKSGRKRTAGPQVIQRLSELGDVRSAVSSLEFLCVRGDEDEGWGAKVTFAKKKSSKDTPMTKMEHESLEMVTQRESTLGLFHAVGRVVYNKRLPDDPSFKPIPQPPNWFPERRRAKASEVQVDALIDELGTDIQTFIAALHENYVLSCGGADSEETMDSLDGSINALSDADLLSPDRFSTSGFNKRNFQGTGADNLRQEEMSFHVGVRGLLFNLPSPVKRLTAPANTFSVKGKGGARGNSFAMYYPSSLRVWRKEEEIGGMLDLWVSRLHHGDLLSSKTQHTGPHNGGVETWKKSTAFSTTATLSAGSGLPPTKPTTEELPPPILLGSGGSARYELLLERLPYLARILRKSSALSSEVGAAIRDIQKITTFTGSTMDVTTEDDDEEEVSVDQEQWATDLPGSESPRKRRKNRIGVKKDDAQSSLSGVMEKDAASMVLSDDDIED
jgi:cell cycle checkpoint protein